MKKKLTLLIFILFTILCGCGKNTGISASGFYFDTVITINLYNCSDEEIINGCMDLCKKYDQLWNKSIETSDIYKINHSDGNKITCDPETIILVTEALKYYSLSDGHINPLIGSLTDLWDFTNEYIPSDDEVNDALSHMDIDSLIIDTDTITLTDPLSKIDVGFIAKGYIADRIRDYLYSKNINSALINLGGNILTVGSKPDGNPFLIGIQSPTDPSSYVATVESSDNSVVTSGTYQRSFVKDNITYHHILDAKTGYPIRNNLLGVTVITDSSFTADALSTTLFVMGLEEAQKYVSKRSDISAYFITDEMDLIYVD